DPPGQSLRRTCAFDPSWLTSQREVAFAPALPTVKRMRLLSGENRAANTDPGAVKSSCSEEPSAFAAKSFVPLPKTSWRPSGDQVASRPVSVPKRVGEPIFIGKVQNSLSAPP